MFPNERTGVIVTPVTKVKEQVNCSSLPAIVVSLPLVVVIVVVSEMELLDTFKKSQTDNLILA